METIEVRVGPSHTALIDECDIGVVSDVGWWIKRSSTTEYARGTRKIDGKSVRVYMHRLILGIVDCGVRVDHINHNGLDNRRENLRIATPSQNSAYRRQSLTVGNPYKGVHWDVSRKKWKATIVVRGKPQILGRFLCAEEAARAYDDAARSAFGDFAYPNFPDS